MVERDYGKLAALGGLDPELKIAGRMLADAVDKARAGDLLAVAWLRHCGARYVEIIAPDSGVDYWKTELEKVTMATQVAMKPVTAAELFATELELVRTYLNAPTEVLDGRIESLRERRRMSAQPDIEALLARAAEMRAKAEKQRARTDALLAEIARIEGDDVVWVPTRNGTHSPGGTRRPWWNVNHRQKQPVQPAATKTQTMLQDAQILEAEAKRAEGRGLPDEGALEATSRADLIAKLESFNPQVIAPRLDYVVAWLDAIAGGIAEDHALAIRLVWTGGKLDVEASGVTLVGSAAGGAAVAS